MGANVNSLENMRNRILLFLPGRLRLALSRFRARAFDIYATGSYSQEGEDMILNRMFSDRKDGFYVDVGAHHPFRFSNTYFFYKRGWRGINIEPNPEANRAFQLDRKRDINLQLGISEHADNISYYCFDEPALNTFDGELAKWRCANTPYKLVQTRRIAVERLDHTLEKHMPSGVGIDFLSVDVEGLDLAVLKSNDWKLFRPKCVLVEALETSLEDAMHGEIFSFMRRNGYELFAKTFNTLIFRDKAIEIVWRDQDGAC